MKRSIVFTIYIVLLHVSLQAQCVKDFYNKYGKDDRFVTLSVGKGAMNMVRIFSGENGEILSQITQVQILAYDSDIDGDTQQKDFLNDFNQLIVNENFEQLLNLRKQDVYTAIFYNEKLTDVLLLQTEGDKESCLIWLKGQFLLETLPELVVNF